jgi:hypothetical protein
MKYRRKLKPDELQSVIVKVEKMRDFFAARKTSEYYECLSFLEYLKRAYSLVRDDTEKLVLFYTGQEMILFLTYQRVKNGRKS